MPQFLNGYPAAWEDITTKKELKEKCTPTTEFYITDFLRSGYMFLNDLPDGAVLTVTNHPKRTWFANITIVDGKVRIK